MDYIIERYNKFEELKEKRSFKHESDAEANLFEKDVIAFIELLKKSVVIERKDVGDLNELKLFFPEG